MSKLSRLDGIIGWIENSSVPTSNAPDVTHANSEAVGPIRMQSGKGGVAHAQFLGTFQLELGLPFLISFHLELHLNLVDATVINSFVVENEGYLLV